jgi:hypothetical protein
MVIVITAKPNVIRKNSKGANRTQSMVKKLKVKGTAQED